MDRLNVRAATADDAPAISALIADYYARRKSEPQLREIGTWYVAEGAGGVHAAQNWADTGTGERWILDTYSYDTRSGRAALGAIVAFAHAAADADRVTLLGVSELDNAAVGVALENRGWVVVGVLRAREPGTPRRTLRRVG